MYLWLKAAHIIFVVAWMAGMLVYPRYKIHQLSASPGEPLHEAMKAASERLKNTILTPSMIIVWVLGLTLVALNNQLLSAGWMIAKLVLVLALSGFHGFFVGLGRKIDNGDATPDGRTLRLLNEMPFVLMIVIVVLAIVRPF